MTRRLRPPVPLGVTCDTSGVPHIVHHAGHSRQVTHIAATWTQPSRWWREGAQAETTETWHYRLVLDGYVVIEAHRDADRWLLDRILD